MRSQLLRQMIMGNQVPQNLAQITTQAQPQQESKPTNLTSTQVHYEKKLISLTCNCSLERNNCPIAAMNKEKVKIISILQDKNSNFFLQIYQNSKYPMGIFFTPDLSVVTFDRIYCINNACIDLLFFGLTLFAKG